MNLVSGFLNYLFLDNLVNSPERPSKQLPVPVLRLPVAYNYRTGIILLERLPVARVESSL